MADQREDAERDRVVHELVRDGRLHVPMATRRLEHRGPLPLRTEVDSVRVCTRVDHLAAVFTRSDTLVRLAVTSCARLHPSMLAPMRPTVRESPTAAIFGHDQSRMVCINMGSLEIPARAGDVLAVDTPFFLIAYVDGPPPVSSSTRAKVRRLMSRSVSTSMHIVSGAVARGLVSNAPHADNAGQFVRSTNASLMEPEEGRRRFAVPSAYVPVVFKTLWSTLTHYLAASEVHVVAAFWERNGLKMTVALPADDAAIMRTAWNALGMSPQQVVAKRLDDMVDIQVDIAHTFDVPNAGAAGLDGEVAARQLVERVRGADVYAVAEQLQLRVVVVHSSAEQPWGGEQHRQIVQVSAKEKHNVQLEHALHANRIVKVVLYDTNLLSLTATRQQKTRLLTPSVWFLPSAQQHEVAAFATSLKYVKQQEVQGAVTEGMRAFTSASSALEAMHVAIGRGAAGETFQGLKRELRSALADVLASYEVLVALGAATSGDCERFDIARACLRGIESDDGVVGAVGRARDATQRLNRQPLNAAVPVHDNDHEPDVGNHAGVDANRDAESSDSSLSDDDDDGSPSSSDNADSDGSDDDGDAASSGTSSSASELVDDPDFLPDGAAVRRVDLRDLARRPGQGGAQAAAHAHQNVARVLEGDADAREPTVADAQRAGQHSLLAAVQAHFNRSNVRRVQLRFEISVVGSLQRRPVVLPSATAALRSAIQNGGIVFVPCDEWQRATRVFWCAAAALCIGARLLLASVVSTPSIAVPVATEAVAEFAGFVTARIGALILRSTRGALAPVLRSLHERALNDAVQDMSETSHIAVPESLRAVVPFALSAFVRASGDELRTELSQQVPHAGLLACLQDFRERLHRELLAVEPWLQQERELAHAALRNRCTRMMRASQAARVRGCTVVNDAADVGRNFHDRGKKEISFGWAGWCMWETTAAGLWADVGECASF
jgi:hypothetical protein